MSSATSTDGSSFRPWHFFVLAGLMAATVAVFLARESTAANIALVTLAVWSAGLAGLALYRTLAPLARADVDLTRPVGHRTRAALESEKALVLRAIKELEFDRAMGKVAATDFDEMVGRLRARAIGILAQLDAEGGTGYRDLIERELRARLASARAERLARGEGEGAAPSGFEQRTTAAPEPPETPAAADTVCPICETANDIDARFCKQCGHPLESGEDA